MHEDFDCIQSFQALNFLALATVTISNLLRTVYSYHYLVTLGVRMSPSISGGRRVAEPIARFCNAQLWLQWCAQPCALLVHRLPGARYLDACWPRYLRWWVCNGCPNRWSRRCILDNYCVRWLVKLFFIRGVMLVVCSRRISARVYVHCGIRVTFLLTPEALDACPVLT